MSERNIFEGIGGTVEFEIENTNELKELFNKTKEESLKIRKRFTDGTYTEDDLLNHLPRFGLGTEDKIEMYVVESKYFEDLANRYTNLKEIEQEHKKENGELREKVKELEGENTILKEDLHEMTVSNNHKKENWVHRSILNSYIPVATSGDNSQVATSGDNSQVEIEGNHSVGFVCGYKSIIKAKKGTWISLCEYGKDKEGCYIPTFATSAQIGNKDYKDFRGRILKETEYYCLYNRKFYPVDISDEIKNIKISEKKRDGITIIKAIDFYDTDEECYIVKEGELNAHGETLQQALEDLQYKKIKSEEVQAIVKEIKKTGKVNKAQYRAITGACQYGTNKFCEEHNITVDEIELNELKKILIDDYGAKRFWELIENS